MKLEKVTEERNSIRNNKELNIEKVAEELDAMKKEHEKVVEGRDTMKKELELAKEERGNSLASMNSLTIRFP